VSVRHRQYERATASIAASGPKRVEAELGLPPLEPLRHATLDGAGGPDGYGLRRIGLTATDAPGRSFLVSVGSPQAGRFTFAAAALPRRVTVISLVLRADGSFDLSQNLLRVPGRRYPAEPVHDVAYARMVRELQIGQELFKSGELVRNELLGRGGRPFNPPPEHRDVLNDLLHAKWTDPILSCLAVKDWLAVREESGERDLGDEAQGTQSARNLSEYFGELPDARIVHALVNPDQVGNLREQVVDDLVASGAIPVLAGHVRLMARFAAETGRRDAPVTRLAELLARDQPWSLTLHPDGMGGLVVQRELAVTVGV
jgi:hypothetical protein